MPNHLSASTVVDAYAQANAADALVTITPHVHLTDLEQQQEPDDADHDRVPLPDGAFQAICDANSRLNPLRFAAGLELTTTAIRVWGAHDRVVFPAAVIAFPPGSGSVRVRRTAELLHMIRTAVDRRPTFILVVVAVMITALAMGWRTVAADAIAIAGVVLIALSFVLPPLTRAAALRMTRSVDRRDPARFDRVWQLTTEDAPAVEIWSAVGG